jgi:hypothetical protein
MPQPKPPKLEQQVAPQLLLHPHPVGDPAPEIWRVIHELPIEQQSKFTKVAVAAQITALEGQVAALRQLHEGLPG